MPGFNAIGTDAIGTSGATSQASFSCALSATSAVAASLTTKIVFATAIVSTTLATANLTSSSAQMSATLANTATAVGSLKTGVVFNSSLSAIAASTATLSSAVTSLSASAVANTSVQATLTNAAVVPVFVPSVARTIFVQATTPVFTGSKWWNLTDAKKPRGLKDPDATFDITFDWSDWLNDIGAVTISDVTFTLKGGLNNVNTFYNGTQATIFVSGGTIGTACTIACKIKTNTTPSRTDERTVYLDIGDE